MENMLGKVAGETLVEQAYQIIKGAIMRNSLLPGQPLSIEDLARDLGVSQTPVREALAKLSAERLVERPRNRVALVAAISEEDVCQVYEVRRLMEPYAASVTANHLSSDRRLEEQLREVMERAGEIQEALNTTSGSLTTSQREAYLAIDLDLQKVILEGLGNTLLRKALSLAGDHSLRTRSFLEASLPRTERTTMSIINQEHLRIIVPLLTGDFEGVQKAMREHLDNAEVRTIRAVAEFLATEREGRLVETRIEAEDCSSWWGRTLLS